MTLKILNEKSVTTDNKELNEKNTLFEAMIRKLEDYPELKKIIYLLLFQGQKILYNPEDPAIDMALMFGFIKIGDESVVIANRIFETRLYNMFLILPAAQDSDQNPQSETYGYDCGLPR